MPVSSVEELQKQVRICEDCQLCRTRHKAVPGKGNSHAEIVFIGEAPGRSEDKAGEPFVGAAGKKLTEALEYAGISRDSVYITNVVKCRPPNNRVPTQEERDSCKKYLDSELEIINPKIICILGNTAYNSILGGNSITKNRGKVITKNHKQYFLTYHPAATIYNQDLVEDLKKDIKKLANLLDGIES